MFYAWRLVKRKLIFNTNKFSVDSEKTSGKVVLFQYAFLSRGYKPRRLYAPSRPLYKVDSCVRSTLEVKHSLRKTILGCRTKKAQWGRWSVHWAGARLSGSQRILQCRGHTWDGIFLWGPWLSPKGLLCICHGCHSKKSSCHHSQWRPSDCSCRRVSYGHGKSRCCLPTGKNDQLYSKQHYFYNLNGSSSPNSWSTTNVSLQFIASYVQYSMQNLAGDLSLGLKFVLLPILLLMFYTNNLHAVDYVGLMRLCQILQTQLLIYFVQGRLGEWSFIYLFGA